MSEERTSRVLRGVAGTRDAPAVRRRPTRQSRRYIWSRTGRERSSSRRLKNPRLCNPSVTYTYRTDQELLQANQNATTYCGQYQTTPRTANLSSNADGNKTVVFECVRTALPAPAPVNHNLNYTYRTDQELVQAAQTAGAYCQKYGSQPITTSSLMTNSDGTRP
jgi:hypothetical protein